MSSLNVPDDMEFNGGSTEAKIISTLGKLTLEGTTGGSTALLGGVDDTLTTIDAGNDQQLVNKKFVDSNTWKTSVRAATTGSIFINSPGTTSIDGLTIVDGDRVLVKNQGSPSQNGIYIYRSASTDYARTDDAQSGYAATGISVIIEEGTTNGGTFWVCDTIPFVNFGSNINFSELSSSSIPSGSNTEAQFNNSSSFGAIEDLTYIKGTNTVTIGESATASIVKIATDTSHSGNINILTGASSTSTLTLGGGTINIGNSKASTVIDLGNSNTGAVNILTGASASGTLNLGSDSCTLNISGVDVPTGRIFQQTVGQTAGSTVATTIGGTGTGSSPVNGNLTTVWQNGANAPTLVSSTRITVNEDGVYYISYSIHGSGSGGSGIDQRRTQGHIEINGASTSYITSWKQVDPPPTQASSECSAEASGIFNLSNGDYFEVIYLQNLGVKQTISSTSKPTRINCIRLSGIS